MSVLEIWTFVPCSLQSAPAARALGPGDIRKFIISPLLELLFCVLALLMIT